MDNFYEVISIYDSFKKKYKNYIKPEIISISIIQSDDEVLLESIESEKLDGGYIKETVSRINLDFVTDGEEDEYMFFDPENTIEINVKRFMEEFTPYSIINTMDLFHEKACDEINKKYMIFGVDK